MSSSRRLVNNQYHCSYVTAIIDWLSGLLRGPVPLRSVVESDSSAQFDSGSEPLPTMIVLLLFLHDHCSCDWYCDCLASNHTLWARHLLQLSLFFARRVSEASIPFHSTVVQRPLI